MRMTQIMLSDTSQYWEVTGDKVRADSWFGNTDGIHTVSVHYTNFYGGFRIQGTLSLDPSEDDWFDIGLGSLSSNSVGPEIRYPVDPLNPTGTNGGDSGSDAFTFVGNFTFLRAVLVRDYLGSAPASNEDIMSLDVGKINKVLLSI
jgi:hypothetical protein